MNIGDVGLMRFIFVFFWDRNGLLGRYSIVMSVWFLYYNGLWIKEFFVGEVVLGFRYGEGGSLGRFGRGSGEREGYLR